MPLGPGSIRIRLFLAFLLVAVTSAGALSLILLDELEAYGLRKLEERLGSEARLVAAMVEASYEVAGAPVSAGVLGREGLQTALRSVSPNVPSRLRVLDTEGALIADSVGPPPDSSYEERPEVRRALAGDYGAHTRVTEEGRVGLFVAIPIRFEGEVAGVSYASASTFSIVTLLRDYRVRLLGLVALFAAATLLIAEGLSRWLSRPLRGLESVATEFARGEHFVRFEPMGSRETRRLAKAFNHMAEEVERTLAELRDEERRKSRFVSDVSHELRTPLTAIRGAAETLLAGGVPAKDERRFLQTIVRESDRLARLAGDLMSLQRIEGATGELPLSGMDLLDVANQAVSGLEPLLAERKVHASVEGSSARVLGDEDRIQQVVANLVDNASRHSPAGGHVQVEVGIEDRRAVLSVRDEGPGVPEEDLSNLFDRFYRSEVSRDRTTGGAGLGLAIVRAIADAHGGEVRAQNLPEGGACFTVSLPLLASQEESGPS